MTGSLPIGVETTVEFASRMLATNSFTIRCDRIEERELLLKGAVRHPESDFLEDLERARTLDQQNIILHRMLANYHLAKIEEITQFIQRKRG